MKKFRFRLEKVLKFRDGVREEKKRILMTCNARLTEAREYLEALEQAARAIDVDDKKVISAEQLLIRGNYGQRLKESIDMQRLEIIQREEQAARALEDYLEAAKEARALEMLRERKRQAYTELVFKEEEKFLDELTVQRAKIGARSGR